MEKSNYKVNIKIDRTLFIEGVNNSEEAIENATLYLDNLLLAGVKPYARTIAVKSDTAEQPDELHVEQLEEVKKLSIQISNVFNKAELKLLAEDIKFYIGE